MTENSQTNIVNFIRYDPKSGQILATGNIPKELLSLQGENVIEGTADDTLQYIDINTKSIIDMPPKPGIYYNFDYQTKSWKSDQQEGLAIIRAQRNYLLKETDWTQGADISDIIKQKWVPYRQALRDITNQPDLENIIWPTPPA